MQVLKENENGTTNVSLDAELLEGGNIYLFGPIDEVMLERFIKQLEYLRFNGPEKEISIFINSPGGSVQAGLAIYDLMTKWCDKLINVTCIGQASSIATIILAAGDKGKRYIYPNSTVLIHEPSIITNQNYMGNATSIKQTAISLIETKNKLYKILANHTNHSAGEIEALVNGKDLLLNAKEAVKFGIADVIIGEQHE